MNKDYLVTKSNYFIMNSSYDLSLEEQKIILTLASMVQPEDEEFKPYKFKISEFMKLIGVEDKSKYTEVPKITKELMKKVFEIHEGKKIIQTAWLSGSIYEKGTGYVELIFSPYLKPYMLKLNSMFTQYKLANVLSMKSKYSPRIYELLKCNEFKKQGYIEIELVELRKLLKADNIYPKYNDFKRYVIERSQKELKKLTDLSFDLEEIKSGRKVTTLKLYIKSNNKKIDKDQVAYDEACTTVLDKSKDIEISKDTKAVITIMNNHKITKGEALKILKSAEGNIDIINKVYEDAKNKEIDNIVGYMIAMVKPNAFNESKKNIKKLKFTSYNQREYDFDDLEEKLLGHHK